MKHIKALSLLLALTLTLTACSENSNDNSSESDEISQITQSTPQSTSSAAQSTSVPEEISEPGIREFPVVIYPKMSIKADGELAEALKPLEEFGRFYATYLFMDMYQSYLFDEKPERILVETTENGDTYNQPFTKVSKCGITTYSAMTEKLDSLLTEKCLDDTAREIRDRFRQGENGELFVENTGAGGYLGDSYLRLNKITYPDDETVLLDMSVIGEAEEWGYEQDRVDDFSITLKRTAGGIKIDGFGGALNKDSLLAGHYDFYPLTLSFIQYNNVFLELDHLTEFTLNSRAEEADKPNRYYRPLNETEEIIKLLEDNAKPGETFATGSALYLDSLEYPDDNSILMKVSSRDVHEDGVCIKATATFTKTPDGLQLKACDPAILDFFAYYPEIRIEGQ